MSYKNKAYASTRKSGSKKDPAAHYYHTKQESKQDQLIKQWLSTRKNIKL